MDEDEDVEEDDQLAADSPDVDLPELEFEGPVLVQVVTASTLGVPDVPLSHSDPDPQGLPLHAATQTPSVPPPLAGGTPMITDSDGDRSEYEEHFSQSLAKDNKARKQASRTPDVTGKTSDKTGKKQRKQLQFNLQDGPNRVADPHHPDLESGHPSAVGSQKDTAPPKTSEAPAAVGALRVVEDVKQLLKGLTTNKPRVSKAPPVDTLTSTDRSKSSPKAKSSSKPSPTAKLPKGKSSDWDVEEFCKTAEYFVTEFGLPGEGENPSKISNVTPEMLKPYFGPRDPVKDKNGYKVSSIVKGLEIRAQDVLHLAQIVDGYHKPVNGVLAMTFVKGVYTERIAKKKVNWALYAESKLRAQVYPKLKEVRNDREILLSSLGALNMDIELEQNKEELSEEGLEGSCKPEENQFLVELQENLANQTKPVQTKEAKEACLMQEHDTLDKVIISTKKSALRVPSVKKQLVSVCASLKAKQALLEDIAAEQLKEELRLGYALSNTVPRITPTFVPTLTAIGSTEVQVTNCPVCTHGYHCYN
ncbi:unnamed protein product [Calypogeia fissa]